jgi:hypothetical protein
MKVVFCLFACLSIALALPQREGAAFTNDAIKQAQSSHLIPAGAEIQNVISFMFWSMQKLTILYQVQEGIELAAYENIPGGQRVNLAEILGAQFPQEVISNLQGQIDGIGRN